MYFTGGRENHYSFFNILFYLYLYLYLYHPLPCFSCWWEWDLGDYLGALQIQISVCLSPRCQAASRCLHMCPPSEPLTYGLYHHWVSTDASRQTWPSFPISAGKFLFRILVIDDDLRGPSWRRTTCAKKVWELLWTGRAHGVGQGRAPLFRSRNPALLNGSLHPLLVLPAISLKLFKKQHVRGRLRNNCIQDYIPMPYLNLCFCTLSWFLLVSFSRYMQRNHCVFNIWSFLKLCSSSLLSKLFF